jgi:ubiquinone/menaquinone biosynthesis C-methylase UbiE/uncharacterized protein YbaR (Trm112 family)
MRVASGVEALKLDALLPRLACPNCAGTLRTNSHAVACVGCDARYTVREGIPVLVPRDLDDQKLAQGAFFDAEVDSEWEIERPFGAPGLYRELLEERFARAIRGLEPLIPGASALVVCGGSGMDAQFLIKLGASVTTSDVSLGAAWRAAERARRFGFEVMSVVADAERLPFRDRSFDLVYVHDGLHHLQRPHLGLAEMARVAGRAVCVNEPARAAITRLAVRLGLALEREESGNRVARLTLDEIFDELAARGFLPARAERYAMYYRHEPGPAIRLLSMPALLPLAKGGFRLANFVAGRFGNKLAVQAVRVDALS